MPDNGGTITVDSDKPCTAGTYPSGTIITLTAVPNEGCSFEQWSGDTGDNQSNSSTISIVMDSDRTITANFKGCAGPLEITVNASRFLYGSDTINASFGILSWNATHTVDGTRMNFTATAAAGYRFEEWSGAFNSSQRTISFIADTSEPITARFSKVSSFPWIWAIIGIVAVLVVGLFIYRLKSGKSKIPEETQNDAAGPPQPLQPTPPQDEEATPKVDDAQ